MAECPPPPVLGVGLGVGVGRELREGRRPGLRRRSRPLGLVVQASAGRGAAHARFRAGCGSRLGAGLSASRRPPHGSRWLRGARLLFAQSASTDAARCDRSAAGC